jgi:hypothetical protein
MEESLSIGQNQQLAKKVEPFTINEEWCFVQNEKGQHIEKVFVNYKSLEGDEGVAWRNSRRLLYNRDHTKENFRCKVLMAHNV